MYAKYKSLFFELTAQETHRSINNSLPTELLTRVFSCVLVTLQNFDLQYNKTRSTLLTVCKYWNDVIVNYPQFWSKFYLDLGSCRRLVLSPLKAWLQRSANIPIEIYIADLGDMGGPWTKKPRIYRRKILQLLLQHISRWKKLALRVRPIFGYMVHNDVDFSRAQRLEEVRLYFECGSMNFSLAISLALKEAPALRSVWFYPCSFTMSALLNGSGTALIERLTRLDITCELSAPEMLETMHRCTSASHIGVGTSYDVRDRPKIRVSSEKLYILELTFQFEDYDTLTSLDLPNLKVLFIKCTREGEDGLASAVSGFIDGSSGNSLQVLKLENFSMNAVDSRIGHAEGLRRIPIFELQVQIRSTTTTNEPPAVLPEGLGHWKDINSRFKICMRSDINMWSVGWVDPKAYVQYQKSLPDDILNAISFGLLD